jgi:phosphate transport system permease protein
MNSQYPINRSFTKESLKKQFRLSEFLAEKIISSVAFLSIAIIFLIFVFVFKESLPIFNFGKEAVKTEIQATESGSKPESYGAEPAGELKPESYGAEPTEDLKPETYGSEPVSQEDLKPETYGDVTAEPAAVSSEETPEAVSENNEGADKTWRTFFHNGMGSCF